MRFVSSPFSISSGTWTDASPTSCGCFCRLWTSPAPLQCLQHHSLSPCRYCSLQSNRTTPVPTSNLQMCPVRQNVSRSRRPRSRRRVTQPSEPFPGPRYGGGNIRSLRPMSLLLWLFFLQKRTKSSPTKGWWARGRPKISCFAVCHSMAQ